MARKVVLLLLIMVAGGAFAVALHVTGVVDALFHASGVSDILSVGVLLPALYTGHSLITEWLDRRDESTRRRVPELVRGRTYRSPLLIAVLLFGYFEVVEHGLSVVFGLFTGEVLDEMGLSAGQVQFAFAALVPLLTVTMITIFFSFMMTRYATYRIAKWALLWVYGAVLLAQVLDIVEEVLNPPGQFTLIGAIVAQLVVVLFYTPGIVTGYAYAKWTHRAYVMRELFRRLSDSDQHDLIGLVETLPGVEAARH